MLSMGAEVNVRRISNIVTMETSLGDDKDMEKNRKKTTKWIPSKITM